MSRKKKTESGVQQGLLKVKDAVADLNVVLSGGEGVKADLVPEVQPVQLISDGVPEPFQFLGADIVVRVGVPQGRESCPVQELRFSIGHLSINAFIQAEQEIMKKLHEASAQWREAVKQTQVK